MTEPDLVEQMDESLDALGRTEQVVGLAQIRFYRAIAEIKRLRKEVEELKPYADMCRAYDTRERGKDDG